MRLNRYRGFLLVALCLSAAVQIAYLRSHEFPALLGGLFLEMAATVAHSDALVPTTIQGFTTDGVPFAYPPLGFYVMAVFLKVGVDGVQLLRFGAPVILLCLVALIYHLTVVLTDSPATGLVAGVITGTHVSLNVYLVGASGFVRGLGFLFMLVAMLGAYQYYANDGGRRALATAVVGWGLVVLTHPVHAAAAGAGVAAAWLVWDRTPRGLATGGAIAVGGLVIASPWWLTVASTHGADIFFTGAGSHGSINHSLSDLRALAGWFWGSSYVLNWPAAFALVGAASLVARGEWHQPAWLAAPVVLLVPPHGRLGILVVAPLGAVGFVFVCSLLADLDIDLPDVSTRRLPGLDRYVDRDLPDLSANQVVAIAFFVVLVGPFVAQNMAAASGTSPYSPLPVYADDEDRTAMEWIEDQTAADAQIAVVGGASEWFPYLANRTSVIVKYGTEWSGRETFSRHESAQYHLRNCWNASCVNATLVDHDFASETDYLYVPYGGFMSGRTGTTISPALHRSLVASEQFTRVYRNEGVGLYAYNRTAAAVSGPQDASAS
ncbi:ArnT family glycosyltransferase [Haloarcula onubensis]|uniref:Glycosyltransferase RgtA/B/C/D-like domain-containing protein n=1 Tax=Haloarcula onubensis TaxID=2950539 RepID=A0ABU2FQ31_9EURY|nr:hypothetical protein [Halomicroarcula sp. S3CR25-11]MDS0282306.1 hypothetical protein [Halomicroarcula sp. S3CR25-11]